VIFLIIVNSIERNQNNKTRIEFICFSSDRHSRISSNISIFRLGNIESFHSTSSSSFNLSWYYHLSCIDNMFRAHTSNNQYNSTSSNRRSSTDSHEFTFLSKQ